MEFTVKMQGNAAKTFDIVRKAFELSSATLSEGKRFEDIWDNDFLQGVMCGLQLATGFDGSFMDVLIASEKYPDGNMENAIPIGLLYEDDYTEWKEHLAEHIDYWTECADIWRSRHSIVDDI